MSVRKAPSRGYTGLKQDTVGPGTYVPSLSCVRTRPSNVAAILSRDKVERRPFDLEVSLPGPGDYELNVTSTSAEANRELYSTIHAGMSGNSCFVSAVPKFVRPGQAAPTEERVGPGSYNVDSSAMESGRGRKPAGPRNAGLSQTMSHSFRGSNDRSVRALSHGAKQIGTRVHQS